MQTATPIHLDRLFLRNGLEFAEQGQRGEPTLLHWEQPERFARDLVRFVEYSPR